MTNQEYERLLEHFNGSKEDLEEIKLIRSELEALREYKSEEGGFVFQIECNYDFRRSLVGFYSELLVDLRTLVTHNGDVMYTLTSVIGTDNEEFRTWPKSQRGPAFDYCTRVAAGLAEQIKIFLEKMKADAKFRAEGLFLPYTD